MPTPKYLEVLAVDPGEKVGWAHGRINTETGQVRIVAHGILHLKDFALYLAGDRGPAVHDRPWKINQYHVVLYERWRLSAVHAKTLVGNDMQTSQLIGMIRLLAWLHGTKLVAQDPKDWHHGRAVAPPTVCAILDTLPKAHDESHDGPALCHLAHYWFKHYFDPTLDPA